METSDGIVLFDTGPESTFANVTAELERIGARASDVRHVLVSHIHFDHAGAAWRFAELGAIIYVHPRGAPHLVDPTKLVESATRIFRDQMDKLWGRVAPLPASQVTVLEDGESVRVADVTIRAIATPGHASHHHVYHWDDCLFGGDIAGVRLGKGPPIPPFVPPELHIESWLESIEKMRALSPATLYLPHFGKLEGGITSHFDELERRVRAWADWFRNQLRGGADEKRLLDTFPKLEHEDLLAHGADAQLVESYETADPSYMAVPAAMRYWIKYHPEAP